MTQLKYLIFILALFNSLSCRERTESKQLLLKYSESLNYFPHELVDHFPRTISREGFAGINCATPAASYALDMCYLFYQENLDSISIADLIKRLEDQEIIPLSPNGSTLIIVGDTNDYSTNESGIPIPSYYGIERDFGLNRVRLEDGYSIYILDAEPGEYLTKEQLGSGDKMPEKWKHGYSRGIAINSDKMKTIYWTVIW